MAEPNFTVPASSDEGGRLNQSTGLTATTLSIAHTLVLRDASGNIPGGGSGTGAPLHELFAPGVNDLIVGGTNVVSGPDATSLLLPDAVATGVTPGDYVTIQFEALARDLPVDVAGGDFILATTDTPVTTFTIPGSSIPNAYVRLMYEGIVSGLPIWSLQQFGSAGGGGGGGAPIHDQPADPVTLIIGGTNVIGPAVVGPLAMPAGVNGGDQVLIVLDGNGNNLEVDADGTDVINGNPSFIIYGSGDANAVASLEVLAAGVWNQVGGGPAFPNYVAPGSNPITMATSSTAVGAGPAGSWKGVNSAVKGGGLDLIVGDSPALTKGDPIRMRLGIVDAGTESAHFQMTAIIAAVEKLLVDIFAFNNSGGVHVDVGTGVSADVAFLPGRVAIQGTVSLNLQFPQAMTLATNFLARTDGVGTGFTQSVVGHAHTTDATATPLDGTAGTTPCIVGATPNTAYLAVQTTTSINTANNEISCLIVAQGFRSDGASALTAVGAPVPIMTPIQEATTTGVVGAPVFGGTGNDQMEASVTGLLATDLRHNCELVVYARLAVAP